MRKTISIFVFTGGKGKLDVTPNPEGAEVFINGISYGKTPVKVKLKTKREYEVVFKKEGYAPVTKKITNKIGDGWIILDVIIGLAPVIVDVATGAWSKFDQKTINAILEKQQP